MRQSEFKKHYDVKTGRYVKRHIYGKGVVTDVFKTIGRKLFGKTMKEAANTAQKRPFRKLLLRLLNMLAKKRAIKLFSY